MLALTRKLGETVVAGDVQVQVLQILRGKVKLGITAPKEIKIHRKEDRTLKYAREARLAQKAQQVAEVTP